MHAVLENVSSRISEELGGLDAQTAQKHPHNGAHLWSMQQVIEHLLLTYRGTEQNLETRLRKGRISRNQRRTVIQWVLQLMVLSFGYFPRGVPAPDETVPQPGFLPALDGRELGERLRAGLSTMDDALGRCRHDFGMERVAVHPLLGPLRVDQWRRFHVIHTLHHLKQLERVREQVAPRLVADRAANAKLAKELQIPAHRSLT